MLLFTAGYPASGKSELVKMIVGGLDPKQIKIIVVDPVSMRPPEYNQMSADDQKAARLATWEVSQEILTSTIKTEPLTTLIIYDSCAAKVKTMMPHFVAAKKHGHKIFYTFVGAKVDECKGRAGSNWPSHDVITQYATDFGESAPRLRPLCDHFKFIKNANDKDRASLKDAASQLVKAILDVKNHRIQESPSVRSATGRAR